MTSRIEQKQYASGVRTAPPPKQGLYDPQFEHDSCGVGFVVHIKGRKSHAIVQQALQALCNLDHRGACGCEANTGDGAGILMQVPHDFLAKAAEKLGFKLPAPGQYGVGMLFMPKNPAEREAVKAALAQIISGEGQTLLGWRDIPTDNASLGKTAVAAEPHMMQVFVGRNPVLKDDTAFERKLYVIRKLAEREIRYGGKISGGNWFYVSSLSCRTVIYKGMLMPEQVGKYFADLRDPGMTTALALVHSRFSHEHVSELGPRASVSLLAHNGEINTLRGNINWMHAAPGEVRFGNFSATTSRKFCPSSTPTAATRRCSTTASNCSCMAGPRTAARDDDDDSRAVGKSREHGRRRSARSTNIIPA